MRFNTAISKLMVFARDIAKDAPLPRAMRRGLRAAALADGAASRRGALVAPRPRESLAYAPWPVADPALLVADEITLVVQVNGKKRGEIEVAADADDDDHAQARRSRSRTSSGILDGREPKKVIVVPGRLVNVVV